jgi:ferritin-like metal-binding protein YciE
MKITSLNELLAEELKDIYSAEKQLLRAMPKMAKKATSPELKSALQEHMEVTQRQVERLEQVFESIGKPAKAKTCKAMQGLLEEATEIMGEDADDAVLDAGIIAAAQKVEHYEIASYGTVRTWARLCGQEEAANLSRKRSMKKAKPISASRSSREPGESRGRGRRRRRRRLQPGRPERRTLEQQQKIREQQEEQREQVQQQLEEEQREVVAPVSRSIESFTERHRSPRDCGGAFVSRCEQR